MFTGLYRLAPSVLDALKILKPETGIGQGSGPIGVGNHARSAVGLRRLQLFASSFVK